MSATELTRTTPVKAVRVRKGSKVFVHLLDASGVVVCQLGGTRAERAQAVFCYAVDCEAGICFGRPTEAVRFFDAGLRADPAQARAYISQQEARRAKIMAMEQRRGGGASARTVQYSTVLLVEDAPAA